MEWLGVTGSFSIFSNIIPSFSVVDCLQLDTLWYFKCHETSFFQDKTALKPLLDMPGSIWRSPKPSIQFILLDTQQLPTPQNHDETVLNRIWKAVITTQRMHRIGSYGQTSLTRKMMLKTACMHVCMLCVESFTDRLS